MEINILIEDEFKGRVTRRWLIETAKAALAAEKAGDNTELGVLITTQDRVQQLNWTYRDLNEPTDVLSFFMIDGEKKAADDFITAPDNVRHLGEVIISYPQALKQAREHKHTVKKEIAILLVHGVLHLLGYDHAEDADEMKMKVRETVILDRITNNQDTSTK